jgi:predicted enzyme related to lactoylglutathione lyase
MDNVTARPAARQYAYTERCNLTSGVRNITIEKVKYTCLIVDDMNAAGSFYRDAFGLRLKFQDGERWSELDAGNGTAIALSSRDESGVQTKGPVVVFSVSDAEGMAASLTTRGADILARRNMADHGYLIAMREPSGNIFQLLEKRVPRP